jgi:hypothetical protein
MILTTSVEWRKKARHSSASADAEFIVSKQLLRVDRPLLQNRKTKKIVTRSVQQLTIDSVIAWSECHLDPAERTMFSNMEMSHEDIYRRSRVDFADRRRAAHADRKRSPCVPGEFRIRR